MSVLSPLAFTLFVDPLPIWVSPYGWALLLLPLCLGVSIVYKSVKCRTMGQVPREAAGIFAWIIVGMVVAAAAVASVMRIVES